MKQRTLLFLVTSLWLTGCASTAAVRPVFRLADASHARRPSEQMPRCFVRVRAEHAETRRLLAQGYRWSPTFRRVLSIIEQSELLVYVFHRRITKVRVGGHLQVMGEANGTRIVFIFINPNLPFLRSIAMIAHELQHAVEIANVRDVVDQQSLARHYERNSTPDRWFGKRYDTAAARAIERVVLAELTHSPRRRSATRAEPELLDAVSDLVAVQPQQRGGASLVAAGSLEGLNHQIPFELLEVDAACGEPQARR